MWRRVARFRFAPASKSSTIDNSRLGSTTSFCPSNSIVTLFILSPLISKSDNKGIRAHEPKTIRLLQHDEQLPQPHSYFPQL